MRWLSWIAVKLHGKRDIRWWDFSAWMLSGNSSFVRVFQKIFELIGWLVDGPVGGFGNDPATLIVRIPTRSELKVISITGLFYGLMGGVSGALVGALVGAFSGALSGALRGALVGALVGALSSWAYDVLHLWSSPLPAERATTPSEVHTKDLQRTIVFGLAFGLAFGLVGALVFGIWSGHWIGLAGGLVIGFVVGLLGGLVFGFGSAAELAWMQRFCAPQGSSVQFIPLLNTALERQILRQAGAVYQFRHAALQDFLTLSGGAND